MVVVMCVASGLLGQQLGSSKTPRTTLQRAQLTGIDASAKPCSVHAPGTSGNSSGALVKADSVVQHSAVRSAAAGGAPAGGAEPAANAGSRMTRRDPGPPSAADGGGGGADNELRAVNAAARLMERAGVGLNVSQLLDFNRARLALYLKTGVHKRRREELRRRITARRGVMIVAGGGSNFANAAVTLRVLRRHLNCSLPVEIVHFGPGERHEKLLAMIQRDFTVASDGGGAPGAAAGGEAGAPPIYITDALDERFAEFALAEHQRPVEPGSFAAKAYALAWVTRFQEVLMLDADNMPLRCPDFLFESQEFREHGNLFWPDFWHSAWVDVSIYKRFGMATPPWEGDASHRMAESGQVLLDRVRHFDVLQWLWLLNSHTEVVYKAVHGDKDTYKLAFIAAGQLSSYQQVPVYAREVMREVPDHTHRFHHLGVIQSAPNKLPAFFHRTSFNSKWFPDCTRQQPHYCEPQWVTVPLEDAQAAHSLKPHMYAWNASEIDTATYKQACAWAQGPGAGGTAGAGGPGLQQRPLAAERTVAESLVGAGRARRLLADPSATGDGGRDRASSEGAGGARSVGGDGSSGYLVVEEGCDAAALHLGTGRMPVPAFPISRLGPNALAVLEASYSEFQAVKDVWGAAT